MDNLPLREDVATIIKTLLPGQGLDVSIGFDTSDGKWHPAIVSPAGRHPFTVGFPAEVFAAEAARELLQIIREVGDRLGVDMRPIGPRP